MSRIDEAAAQLWADTTQVLQEDDDVDAIYERLDLLRVELDDDPLAYGPKRLNLKVSMCRKALGECERIFSAVSQKIAKAKKDLRAKSAGLELSTKFLFANDPEVRSGRNVSDREATAAVKLKDEWMQVKRLEQTVQDFEAVLVVIKSKRTDLKDTEGRLRDQIRLCQEELGLGARWGSKPPPGSDVTLLPGIGGPMRLLDPSNLDTLLASIQGEVHVGPATQDEEVEEVPAAPEIPSTQVEAPKTTKLSKLVEDAVASGDTFVLPDSDLDDVVTALMSSPTQVVEEVPQTQVIEPIQVGVEFGEVVNLLEVMPGSGSDTDVDSVLEGIEIPTSKPNTRQEIDEQTIDDLLEAFG